MYMDHLTIQAYRQLIELHILIFENVHLVSLWSKIFDFLDFIVFGLQFQIFQKTST